MADDPQLGELSRKIEDFRRDVRDDFQTISIQLAQFVLREVYTEREKAQDERIARLEKENADQRSSIRNALLAAAASILASILVAIVVPMLTKAH